MVEFCSGLVFAVEVFSEIWILHFFTQVYFQAAVPQVSAVMLRVDSGKDKWVIEQRPLKALRGFVLPSHNGNTS